MIIHIALLILFYGVSSSICFLGDKSKYNDKNILNFLLEFSNIDEIVFLKNYDEAKDLISNKQNIASYDIGGKGSKKLKRILENMVATNN